MKKKNKEIYKKAIVHFFIFLTLLYSIGCQYFKVNSITNPNDLNMYDLGKIHKYFIVHIKEKTFCLKDISLDSTKLSGRLELPQKKIYYNQNLNTNIKKSEIDILNEIHFYLNNSMNDLNIGQVDIPLECINEIRIIEKDTGKTTFSAIIGTLGVLAGAFVLVSVIVALTKSSCPFVYVNDGEGYVFEGEIFGGAIAKNLARDDYMPLPSIEPANGNYHLRISNELKEKQYTDLAQLIVVNHPKNTKILLDKYGNPQIIDKPVAPQFANSYSGENLLPILSKVDKSVYMFNDEDFSKNGIIIKFSKPEGINKGKLLLNASNSLWFDYLFGKFLSKFGVSYNTWMKKQEQIPKEERIQRMTDSDFPLSIYIKSNNQWKLVDYLNTVGPLAARNFVIPVDFSDIKNNEIEIKIETGFMFWEIDYACIDFSSNSELNIAAIQPKQAIGTGLKNWKSALENIDNQYMIQENSGEFTELLFTEVPRQIYENQTVFLHSRGYYELIRNFKGIPQINELNKFKIPGYFSDYSRIEYLKTKNSKEIVATINKN
ncbi:MAG: hypothetical protein U0W24_11145 [Bacteroidales bacterium]